MIAAGAVAADTEAEAQRLVRTGALSILRLRSGRPGLVPTPEEAEEYPYTDLETEVVSGWLANVVYGEPAAVRQELDELLKRTEADELMITSNVHGSESRLRSFELIARAYDMVCGQGGDTDT